MKISNKEMGRRARQKAAASAVAKCFDGEWFSIRPINKLADNGNYKHRLILRLWHCVDFTDMSRDEREALEDLATEAVKDIEKEPLWKRILFLELW